MTVYVSAEKTVPDPRAMPQEGRTPQGNTHRIFRWLGASYNQRQQRMRVPSAYQPTIRKLMEAKALLGFADPAPFCADGQYFGYRRNLLPGHDDP